MRRRAALFLAAVLTASLLSGCAGTAADAADPAVDVAGPAVDAADGGGYAFRDALDREVVVDDPQRVVALMGGFAEVWLLAGGELAGVTDDALSERELDLPGDIPVVGDFSAPSLEAVLALDPDLVVLSSETSAQVALLDALDGAGVTAAYFSVTHFDDYLDMLRVCTGITGRPELYEAHGAAVEEEILALLDAARADGAPSVLLLITWSGGAAVQSADTMTGRMLRELGCENLTDRLPGLLREFSLETVIAEDPDYLLVIAMGNDDELARRNLAETLESHPAWQGLSAVQNGRYVLLPKELFLYKPNARWAESYRYLTEVLDGA